MCASTVLGEIAVIGAAGHVVERSNDLRPARTGQLG
jgi:hypothetical protein